MKKVIHLIKGVPTVSEVPDDWIECSVSREYRPPEEFQNADGVHCRTNCTETVYMTGMRAFADENKKVIESYAYRSMRDKFFKELSYFTYSVPVRDMIEALQKLDKDSRLLVTQEGYYRSGEFGDIFDPCLEKEIDGVKFYSIGHSSQHP